MNRVVQELADAGDRVLSLGEAGAMYRVRPETIRNWCVLGKIPHIRTPGGHRRVMLSDLVKAMEARQR
jgi:predicted site-specific integrase-resolvase